MVNNPICTTNLTLDSGVVVKVAFRQFGTGGQPVLLLRGFMCADGIWMALRHSFKPDDFAFWSLDLPGTGAATLEEDVPLDPYSQADVLASFVKAQKLQNLILVTHGLAAFVATEAMTNQTFATNVARLVFLNPDGAAGMPPGLNRVLHYADNGAISRFSNPELGAYLWLQDGFFDPAKITPLLVKSLSDFLCQPGAPAAIGRAARASSWLGDQAMATKLSNIKVPTLLLQGANDCESARKSADFFHQNLAKSIQLVFRDCVHFVQCEHPERTATTIIEFASGRFDDKLSDNEVSLKHEENWLDNMRRKLSRKRRFRMSKLIDSWTLDSLLLIGFVKFLQFLKWLGMSPSENGWRKATGIFMRSEASKFMLGTFRLHYWKGISHPTGYNEAKALFIGRMTDFLRQHAELRWAVKPGAFRLRRRRLDFCDIIEVEFDADGSLVKAISHFDPAMNDFGSITPANQQALIDELVRYYNFMFSHDSEVSTNRLIRHLWRWVLREHRFSFTNCGDFNRMINRIFSAAFIRFERLMGNSARMFRRRIATPDTRFERNFGWGMLNMKVRFTAELDEADLWIQYHHVPVDGMPMQELLTELKQQWGGAGEIVYPDPGTPTARPEISYIGKSIFRARMLVDFSSFFRVRKEINRQYANAIGGGATIAGMILWGLGQHQYFRDRKMLLPVDIIRGVRHCGERELSLVFIRPGEYYDPSDRIGAFIRFQREFNLRTSRTRTGRSESYEVLELYSMIHPVFYYIAKYFMPSALKEIVGSVGLSIMRESEAFIAPLSDLQSDGFMAVGNMGVPTVSGGKAGAISICGTRRQIGAYMEAISYMAMNYDKIVPVLDNAVDTAKR